MWLIPKAIPKITNVVCPLGKDCHPGNTIYWGIDYQNLAVGLGFSKSYFTARIVKIKYKYPQFEEPTYGETPGHTFENSDWCRAGGSHRCVVKMLLFKYIVPGTYDVEITTSGKYGEVEDAMMMPLIIKE